jgi:hypothetical protein
LNISILASFLKFFLLFLKIKYINLVLFKFTVMSNRSSSKQHCLVGKKFPKAKAWKKRNKLKARLRRQAAEEVVAAKSSVVAKAPAKKAPAAAKPAAVKSATKKATAKKTPTTTAKKPVKKATDKKES